MGKDNRESDIEAEIRRRIEKRFDKRAEFFSHLIAFLVTNGAGWFLLMQMGSTQLATTVCSGISLLWAMGLAIHAVQYLFEEGKERVIQREIERERASRYYGYSDYQTGKREKAKNRSDERALQLTDDGELSPLIDDDELDASDEANKPPSRSRTR